MKAPRLEPADLKDGRGDLQEIGLRSALEQEEVDRGSEKTVSERDRFPGLLLEEIMDMLLMLLFRSKPRVGGEGRRTRGDGRLDLKLSFSESCPVMFRLKAEMLLLKLFTRSKAAPRAGDWSTRD